MIWQCYYLVEKDRAMATFLIYRLKEQPSQQFRWSAHVTGATEAKRKDYEEGERIEAENEYAAWHLMKESGAALRVGDVLESESGALRICKYVGFDDATWIIPPVKTGLEAIPAASGPSAVAEQPA